MTEPKVELDAELVELAARVAESRGERLEDVIDRLLRGYVGGDAGAVQVG